MIAFNTRGYVDRLYGMAEREFAYDKHLPQGDFPGWQRAFRRRLRELTGLDRIATASAGVPLSARSEGVREFPGYTMEKLYIMTEPGIEVPFYLLLPRSGNGPYPLVLTVHGHSRRGKEVFVGNFADAEEEEHGLSGERDIARQAVHEGYAAIAMDVRGFWEMARKEEQDHGANNSCNELQKRALLFGRTLIGERVHDMGRLIDYATGRQEIDTSRIAIVGQSGGGTVSLFAAALDERISICVSGSYLNTFKDSILSIRHCDCNYVPNILQLGEMYDVAGLIAPRPFLAVNGKEDPIFPIDAARAAFGHIGQIYKHAGAGDCCEFYEGEGGHRFYKAPVWPFVRKHMERLKRTGA